MPEYCQYIIDELVLRRKEKGWTQTDLANATQLTQSVIARMENKKITPKIDTLIKIAKALDCKISIQAID